VHNWATAREVYDAVAAIECIVLTVYGGFPEND
jgi:hypothetical protein